MCKGCRPQRYGGTLTPGFPLVPIIGTSFRIRNFLKNRSESFRFWPILPILFRIWPILTNSDQSCSEFDPFCSDFDQFCSDFDKFCSEFDQFCSDFDHFPYVPITHSAWVETLTEKCQLIWPINTLFVISFNSLGEWTQDSVYTGRWSFYSPANVDKQLKKTP